MFMIQIWISIEFEQIIDIYDIVVDEKFVWKNGYAIRCDRKIIDIYTTLCIFCKTTLIIHSILPDYDIQKSTQTKFVR